MVILESLSTRDNLMTWSMIMSLDSETWYGPGWAGRRSRTIAEFPVGPAPDSESESPVPAVPALHVMSQSVAQPEPDSRLQFKLVSMFEDEL